MFGYFKQSDNPSDNRQCVFNPFKCTKSKARIVRRESQLRFYEGGVPKKFQTVLTWVGRVGFIAKGIVYGCIGVLTLTNLTGAWTPNGSEGNESPQGAFLLLGGIPTIGKSILIVMAVGLCLYIVWRFWEAITGQGSDASFKQQASASSNTFPGSWTESAIGRAGVALLGIAFLIAFITQMINAVKAPFINDLKTSAPNARRWEAFLIHWMGRIGFFGRAALFGTMSGFFWDSLAKRNESGDKNMVAAAVSKLATTDGGRFFMGLLGVCLVIYALFAVLNAYYKYFPTPPPTRQEFYTNEFVHPETSDSDLENQAQVVSARESMVQVKQVSALDRFTGFFHKNRQPSSPDI
ncbi:unnamed protein product [Rhizopus stolonifer]